jgi:hypothetical protein
MLFKFTAAFLLLGLTVLINAVGLTVLMRRLHLANVHADPGPWSSIWLLIRLAAGVVAVHILAISLWAGFYWWENCLEDFQTALYFSIITYTTVGYGDVVLTSEWRLLAGVEALTGILMCGLSTGYFFAIVNRLHTLRAPRDPG